MKIYHLLKSDNIRFGTPMLRIKIKYTGQNFNITPQSISIRLSLYGTILRTQNKSLVDRSDLLTALVYDKLKTVDIVGFTKIEENIRSTKIKMGR